MSARFGASAALAWEAIPELNAAPAAVEEEMNCRRFTWSTFRVTSYTISGVPTGVAACVTIVRVMLSDLRYAVRGLRAAPAFTAVAVLSLALGIGANTAIFSLVDAGMLRPLPVDRPEQLLQVTTTPGGGISNPVWEQIRDRQDVFSGLFAWGRWGFNLAAGGEVRSVHGYFVSGQFFDTLGVHAALGRTLTTADDRRGCPGGAVLSHAFWQREYGGSPAVLGRSISINSHPIEVVGVAERRFTGVDVGSSVEIMVPLCAEKIIQAESSLLDINTIPGWLRLLGRPKAGIPAAQVTARLNMIAPAVFQATVPRNKHSEEQQEYVRRTLDTEPAAGGISYVRSQYSQALTILMTIAAVVLLIACANIANLLLARGAARRREIAIRTALGAGRARLIRQLLTESLLLSFVGTAAGILVAHWSARLLVRYLDIYLDLTPDARVLAFTAAVAALTTLLFGLAPALRTTGPPVRGGSGLGKLLVTAQIALSLVLLIGAGLMLSTFRNLANLDPGFDREHVLLVTVDLRNGRYPPERRAAIYREMLENLRSSVPAARSAAASGVTPICGCMWTTVLAIDGYSASSRADVTVYQNRVTPRYFETLGMALLAGRDFDARDLPGSGLVAIVNQTLARKYFGAENPIGRYYRPVAADRLTDPVQIVGVVADARYSSLRQPAPPTVYTPLAQNPAPSPRANFEIRAVGHPPAALVADVKSAIAAVDGRVSLEFTTLSAQVDESLERERLLAALSALFGVLALLLATIGLYGVIAYNVARRTSEIGMRMALGARPAGIMRMVLGDIAVLLGAGLLAGLAASGATTRLIASLLYGLTPNDPLTVGLAVAILAAATLAAGYIPAHRAARLDPVSALREGQTG
jgi:putative ABC transport system permease protein